MVFITLPYGFHNAAILLHYRTLAHIAVPELLTPFTTPVTLRYASLAPFGLRPRGANWHSSAATVTMTNFPPSACGLWGKFVTVPAQLPP
jgi:hypothetical protein